jgi:hypothetical protein
MNEIIHEFSAPFRNDEQSYSVHVLGRERDDGYWEGWLEFVSSRGERLTTDCETQQVDREDLGFWAAGLEPAYLEGAFTRARDRSSPKNDR